MSYHVEFHASSKTGALRVLDAQPHLPGEIRHKLTTALLRMQHQGPVSVKATGHLHDGSHNAQDASWGEFSVQPIYFADLSNVVTSAGNGALRKLEEHRSDGQSLVGTQAR